MRARGRSLVMGVVVAALLGVPAVATSGPDDPAVATFDRTKNLHPMGSSGRANTGNRHNSDLAFWGKTAYQGHYDGFRIIDITEPDNPTQLINYTDCRGDQGDVIVWEHLLVRSWNSPASSSATCDGQMVAPQFEGLHVFDVSDPLDPALVAQVPTPCGSHTATGVPDLENGRLLVYNSASSGSCPEITIVSVPLDMPALSMIVGAAPSMRSCHDTGVILGDAMLAACAGGNGFTVFSIGGEGGGTLTTPLMLYSKTLTGVSIGHSAAFSFDGEVLIFGHEPGGGGQAQCQETSSTTNKTLFFFESRTGDELGRWVLPRPQTNRENCTIHNFNVVPSTKRDILVSGNYQSGIAVVDFTDVANPVEIAYADPAPLSTTQLILGGDWSTYWYDGRIYESDITRGLIVWNMSGSAVAGVKKTGHLNPQTQEFTL